MPRLVTGIHAILCKETKQDVDARHKAGHDGVKLLIHADDNGSIRLRIGQSGWAAPR
jgi:hypothetical protein